TLQPGQTSTPLNVVFRNTGTQTWTKGVPGQEARLGINGDDAQWAPLAVNWPFTTRVAVQSEAAVAPGTNATFTFQVRAPQSPGTYALHLRPVVDGQWWMEDQGVFLTITVPGVPIGSGSAPTLVTAVVQSGLHNPWDIAFAPDGRMFVTERGGNILVYASGAPGAAQLANNGGAGIHAAGDPAATGIALDPAFAQWQGASRESRRHDPERQSDPRGRVRSDRRVHDGTPQPARDRVPARHGAAVHERARALHRSCDRRPLARDREPPSPGSEL